MAEAFGHNLYTAIGYEPAEREIHRIVTGIRDCLVERLRPTSVVLSGSLGKGEGTVELKNGGGFTLWSDYEIGIVHKNGILRNRLKKLEAELAEKYSVDLTLNFFLPRRFTRGVCTNWSKTRRALTIDQYELFHGARFIHGPDLRLDGPAVSVEDIPVWEGMRLLLNRMAELMRVITGNENSTALLWRKAVMKLLTACGDNCLLLSGRYHYSYRERRDSFAALSDDARFPVESLSRDDRQLIYRGYQVKLSSGSGPAHSPEDLLKAIAISDSTFRTVVKREMNLDVAGYRGFAGDFVSASRERRQHLRYYRNPVADNMVLTLKNRGKIYPYTVSDVLSPDGISSRVFARVPKWLFSDYVEYSKSHPVDGNMEDTPLAGEGRAIIDSWQRYCR